MPKSWRPSNRQGPRCCLPNVATSATDAVTGCCSVDPVEERAALPGEREEHADEVLDRTRVREVAGIRRLVAGVADQRLSDRARAVVGGKDHRRLLAGFPEPVVEP